MKLLNGLEKMKKSIIILAMIITTLLLTGCTNTTTTQEEQEPNDPLFIIMDTGINDSSAYIDVQNIDTKTIRCYTGFTFTYLDEDSVGEDYDYGGGSTGETGPSGIYTEPHTRYKDIEPHHTMRISKHIPSYSGYSFLKWNYTAGADFI